MLSRMTQVHVERRHTLQRERIFGLAEWIEWLDQRARAIFGLSGEEFEDRYKSGIIDKSGVAEDLASVLPTIDRLRRFDRKT